MARQDIKGKGGDKVICIIYKYIYMIEAENIFLNTREKNKKKVNIFRKTTKKTV